MWEVAIQSANDTNNVEDGKNIDAVMAALTFEIYRIASAATWVVQSVMASTGSYFSFQVGKATDGKNQISFTIGFSATTNWRVRGAVNGGAVSFNDYGTSVNGATSSNS